MFWIAIILGIAALIIQALVVYYGIRLCKVVGHTAHWSIGWKLYVIANGFILFRRSLSFLTLVFTTCDMRMLSYMAGEEIASIIVSVLLLCFGKHLNKLFKTFLPAVGGKFWNTQWAPASPLVPPLEQSKK